MSIDQFDIKKNGSITISSIFEFKRPLDITLLVDKCRRVGCTVRFENEDLTIDDSFSNDSGKRAILMLYTLLARHPKAAQDYYNYIFSQANKKQAPGE